jgi:transposase
VHPFFLAPSGEAAVGLFLTERMRLSSSPHPQNSAIPFLQQRKRTGQIGARHAYSGRKPLIVQAHENQMRTLLAHKPDMTLKELREALDLECSLPAIHYVLSDMGLTYKKRHSVLASRTGRTSRGRAKRGGAAN